MRAEPFRIYIDDDTIIQVRFVGRKELGRQPTGHSVAGEYDKGVIKIARWEPSRTQQAIIWHEIGHALVKHDELAGRGKYLAEGTTEEDVCELFTWVTLILRDPRNQPLWQFMGVE